MKKVLNLREVNLSSIALCLVPFVLFWVILFIKVPDSLSYYLSVYSFVSFLIVLLLYYLCYRLLGRYAGFAVLCLSMLLVSVPLSYKWTSGYSDNMVIGGLLPYKDAKNYYYGANLIMNGLPLINAGQSTERPLFPGFLSSLFLLTDQNLKITLALITQLAAVGLYLSARQIRAGLGDLAASLYITFMYFYIQPLIGYTLSESLGFILGCFAFCLLWRAAYTLKWFDLLLGLLTLLTAVSARAGAFFIFPMLILWVGWIFRGEKRFSLKSAAYAFISILAGYFLLNRFYAQFLGIPPGFAFGNFSYALYGQVRGGIGWHSAIEELGTRNPATVYDAVLQFFLKHPTGLLVGFAKAYRDFFLPSDSSIFPFKLYGWQHWFDIVIWLGVMVLLLWGLILVIRNIRANVSAFVTAGFVGLVLSIPFLPPIDGGARFYASTMPFLFVLPAVGIAGLSGVFTRSSHSQIEGQQELVAPRFGALLLIVLTLILPIAIHALRQKTVYTSPSCAARQIRFAIEPHRGSYIDLVKDGTAPCGFAPEVCLSEFDWNNSERSNDDYYQTLMALANEEAGNLRIIPALDLIDERFHYFLVPQKTLPFEAAAGLVSGCATEIRTKNQSIYYMQSIESAPQ